MLDYFILYNMKKTKIRIDYDDTLNDVVDHMIIALQKIVPGIRMVWDCEEHDGWDEGTIYLDEPEDTLCSCETRKDAASDYEEHCACACEVEHPADCCSNCGVSYENDPSWKNLDHCAVCGHSKEES